MLDTKLAFEDFCDSFESYGTKTGYRSSLIKFDFSDISKWENEDYILEQFEQAKPNTITQTKVSKSGIRAFLRYCYEHAEDDAEKFQFLKAEMAVADLPSGKIWERIGTEKERRFISFAELKRVIKEIDVSWDNPNALSYSTLFLAVYEGVYSNTDLAIINNVRLSDIEGNILHADDGEQKYDLVISDELKEHMKELGSMNTMVRKNRYREYEIPVYGKDVDSVFKREQRLGDDYNGAYRNKIRTVVAEFLDYNLKPKALYVSGLMHKIKIALENNGHTLEDGFACDVPSKEVLEIIRIEMNNFHYPFDYRVLKNYVMNNLSDF